MSASCPRGDKSPAATDRSLPVEARLRQRRRTSYPRLGPGVKPADPQNPTHSPEPADPDPWSFADKWYRWEIAQDLDADGVEEGGAP